MAGKWILSVAMVLVGLGGFGTVNANTPQDWRIIINIPEYRLYLYQGSEIYQSFPVAVGKPSTPSPVGDFWIINKVINPIWSPAGRKPVPPGPQNPLGKYWLGLSISGYGIHGNNASSSIGNPVSNGCFRMDNQDIKTVFQLVPKGTPVKIIYAPLLGRVDSDQRAWLDIYKDIYNRVNRETEIPKILSDLPWGYQPHIDALRELVKMKEEGTVEIPRMVHLGGELSGEDAFYWNNCIYIAKACFSSLNENPVLPESNLFARYIELDALKSVMRDNYCINWNHEQSLLEFYRIKLLVNGVELKQAIRYIQNMVYLDLKKVCKETGSSINYPFLKSRIAMGEIRVHETSGDDTIWIYADDLPCLIPKCMVKFDKVKMMVELIVEE